MALAYVFIFIATMKIVFSQPMSTTCVLDIQLSSAENSTNCKGDDWDGFLNHTCCGTAFDAYLYGLARRANQTGQIYLSSTQQFGCLNSMKGIEEDVMSCGINKLVSGSSGCSNYSVTDVKDMLGNMLTSLYDDCKNLGVISKSDEACHACSRRWENLDVSSSTSNNATRDEYDICRFAVLMTLMSTQVNDKIWVERVFECLGEQNSSADERAKVGSESKLAIGMWILIGVGIGVFLIVVGATLIMFIIWRKAVDEDSVSGESGCLKILIKDIYSATNYLHVSNFIGQGVAGKVYKGILSDGQHVAVKQIINDEYAETFVREVRSLSHVRHPNLVALLGYCEGDEGSFLVYELCHNGNLSEWLFSKDKVLSWNQRLKIAIDSASGLWFLHTYPEGCIVHRDIKPTNILISKSFQAKLSDFGLSKVMEVGQSYVSSEVRGTFGYVDPEYQKNHRVNASGDVYSFGIVLLQVLSGQRVINLNLSRPMPIDKMAKMLTRSGNVAEFADKKLDGNYSVEAFNLVLKLALSCTGHKQQRPSMEQVVMRLEKALDVSTSVTFVKHHLSPQ
ncbi:SPARK domain [Dillenia turbinata]|uniref:SPARK domain n=1 Tax=Dillenia turbinata TaxID=194707 RepID=A0AAN8VJJ1_9MAGN